RRGIKPSDLVKVGDVGGVKIIKFDRETGKLSLSLKQTMADPWANVGERYGAGWQGAGGGGKGGRFGGVLRGARSRGGMLPVSEMSYTRVKHPSDIVKEGDTLRLVVISVDPVNRKIGFSLKQAGPDPWKSADERYPKETVVTGTVTRVVDFGAFVEVETGL